MQTSDEFFLTMPLAARMRPNTFDEFYGQKHLLAEGKPLREAILKGHLHSMIFWGPTGTGKTSLAHLIACYAKARVETLSAVLAGVKEIREAVERAQQAHEQTQQATILFVDEIHRFNKSQQDVFLPHVENGVFTLIGATTENPSFNLNNALLSRTRVYVLKRLQENEIVQVIEHALKNSERGVRQQTIEFPEELRQQLAIYADGDARQALNLLEIAVDLANTDQSIVKITPEILQEVLGNNVRRFDKGGDIFHDQISALHKAVRGSSPDAALYWLVRMLDGGCDSLYIARRIVRMASEDIGNADPRGLQLALNAWETQERLGSPEGELALAQAVIYLACAAKSNAVYLAFNAALADVKKTGSLDVPLYLRNAPTKFMKELEYGKNYRYAHDEKDAYAVGEQYFPEEMGERKYYYPVQRGLEIQIAEKLARLRALDDEKK